MGACFGNCWFKLSPCCQKVIWRVPILGLDASGRTSFLYRLKYNEVIRVIPTIGFNVECFTNARCNSLAIWDIGGNFCIRNLWDHYTCGAHAIIYAVDFSDAERLRESQSWLIRLYKQCEEKYPVLRTMPLLVLASKCDLLSPYQTERALADILELDQLQHSGPKKLMRVSVLTGENCSEALDWLFEQIEAQQKQ